MAEIKIELPNLDEALSEICKDLLNDMRLRRMVQPEDCESEPEPRTPRKIKFDRAICSTDQFDCKLVDSSVIPLFKSGWAGHNPATLIPVQFYCGNYYYRSEDFTNIGRLYSTIGGAVYKCTEIHQKVIELELEHKP
jgi:hypothetical protein